MMDLPARLDRFVHRTRLDFLTPFGAPRPRNLRWLPVLVLVLLPLGYVLESIGLGRLAVHQGAALALAGVALFWGAVLAAILIPVFGPRVTPETHNPDERELGLRARAGNVSGQLLGWLAMLACFYLSSAAALNLWRPESMSDWLSLGFVIYAYMRLMPSLVASWLQDPPDPDE